MEEGRREEQPAPRCGAVMQETVQCWPAGVLCEQLQHGTACTARAAHPHLVQHIHPRFQLLCRLARCKHRVVHDGLRRQAPAEAAAGGVWVQAGGVWVQAGGVRKQGQEESGCRVEHDTKSLGGFWGQSQTHPASGGT